MTKEQAVKIFKNQPKPCGEDWEEDWINIFVALGMLPLDEPQPTPREKFHQAFIDLTVEDRKYVGNVLGLIDRAGLQLVEKTT